MSYTQVYGLEFNDWVRLKSQRIRDCLIEFYERNQAIDINYLIQRVYFQRVSLEPFSHWRAIDGHLLDFKPSPFIKSFVTYLIERLHQDGYLRKQVQLELVESITLSEQFGSQNSTTSSSNNQQITRIKERYFVVKIPDLDYLISLNFRNDPIERAFYEELSKVTSLEEYEGFTKRFSKS